MTGPRFNKLSLRMRDSYAKGATDDRGHLGICSTDMAASRRLHQDETGLDVLIVLRDKQTSNRRSNDRNHGADHLRRVSPRTRRAASSSFSISDGQTQLGLATGLSSQPDRLEPFAHKWITSGKFGRGVTLTMEFHHDLKLARFIPKPVGGPRVTRIVRRLKIPPARVPRDMLVKNVMIPGRGNRPDTRLRIHRPRRLAEPAPALLWMHGGGYFMGNVEQDDRRCMAIARELGITVAAVAYRLAPEHVAPAALEDAYACLGYLCDDTAAQHVDPTRIALGGTSAGGGLTAGLALLALDRGEYQPVFQLMAYPVLDDRAALCRDRDDRNVRLYTADSQLLTWRWYLGREPGGPDVSEYAAPARRADLSGLPPAWIGVCTFDVLHDEGVEYAHRLNDAGVHCDLHVVEGGFHGFDVLFPRRQVTRTFRDEQLGALRRALFAGD